MTTVTTPKVDLEALRSAIQEEYEVVAADPGRGFHFHTGRPLARLLGYEDAWLVICRPMPPSPAGRVEECWSPTRVR